LIATNNPIAQDLLHREINAMEKELCGAYPSPLERLLVERICVCHFQVQQAEITFTQKAKGSISLAHGDYYQRLIDRANQRYLAAIRALAQVRRLLTPVVQVNVAEKQINLAGPGTKVLNAGVAPGLPDADAIGGEMGHNAPDIYEALQNTDAPLPGVVCIQYVTRGNKRHAYYARFWRERGKLHKQYTRMADVERVQATCATRQEREAARAKTHALMVAAFGAVPVEAQQRQIRRMPGFTVQLRKS